MFANTIGFLKKNDRPPIRSPKPDIVNDVRITTTVRARISVCAKLTPKMNAAKKKEIVALSRPSSTWIIALPMKSGILWAGVAKTSGSVPSHLSCPVILMTEKTVFQDKLCSALPITMNETVETVAPANSPTNAKKAIWDKDKTNFIVSHIDGLSQSNCARNEKAALLRKTFRLFMPAPSSL
jgi:hypothetical protein